MYHLSILELNGELGLLKSPCEGIKWLKCSREHTTAEFPYVLHKLTLLHECGIDKVIFVDCKYAAKLLAQASEYATELLMQVSELSNALSPYRLGKCYEYGKMGCPQDPVLSIHYYVHLWPSCAVSPP